MPELTEFQMEMKIKKERRDLVNALSNAQDRFRPSWGWRVMSVLERIINFVDEDNLELYAAFSGEESSKISYARRPGFNFDYSKRTKTTLGRFVRRIMKISDETFSDECLHQLTNFVFALRLPVEGELKELKGNEIKEAYSRNCGLHTCMSGEDSHLVHMYTLNPDKVSLLVLGKDMSRALLWTTDEGERVLDRIYPNDGGHIEAIHNWCEKNGIVFRKSTGAPCSCQSTILSDFKEHKITLRHNGMFPYLDTFCWGQVDDKKVIISNSKDFGDRVFHSTSGSSYLRCSKCGDIVDETHEIDGLIYCSECARRNHIRCWSCNTWQETDDGFTYAEDVEGFFCANCARTLCVTCSDCGNSLRHRFNRVSDTGRIYCWDCAEEASRRCSFCHNFYESGVRRLTDEASRSCRGHGDNRIHICENCATGRAEFSEESFVPEESHISEGDSVDETSIEPETSSIHGTENVVRSATTSIGRVTLILDEGGNCAYTIV